MSIRAISTLLVVCLAIPPVLASEVLLETDDQKTIYALGVVLSQRLKLLDLTRSDLAFLQAGIEDGALALEPRVEMATYGPKIDSLAQARQATLAAKERQAGQAFRDKAAAEPGVVTTETGLLYLDRSVGNGAQPSAESIVKLEYEGKFVSGRQFDSSAAAGEPAVFQLGEVAPCLSEGLKRMKVGGKSRLICPPELAYGDAGFPPLIPPGSTLIFEIELLEIVVAAKAAPADPADPAAAAVPTP